MDGDKEITIDNIRDAMKNLGREISNEELEQVMKLHDKDGDRKLQFDEFKLMMLGVGLE